MKKRMRILTFLLAGAMVFTGVPGTGMLATATGNVVAFAAGVTLPTTSGAATGANVKRVEVLTADEKTISPTEGVYHVTYTGADLVPTIKAYDAETDGNILTADENNAYKLYYYDASGEAYATTAQDMTAPGKYYIQLRNLDGSGSEDADKCYNIIYEVDKFNLGTATMDNIEPGGGYSKDANGLSAGWGETLSEVKGGFAVKATGDAVDALADTDHVNVSVKKVGEDTPVSGDSTKLDMGSYEITVTADEEAANYEGTVTIPLEITAADSADGTTGKIDLASATGLSFGLKEVEKSANSTTGKTDIRTMNHSGEYEVSVGADLCTTELEMTVTTDPSDPIAGTVYSNETVSLDLAVRSSGVKLNEGEDYTVSYQKVTPTSDAPTPTYAALKADKTEDGLTSIKDAGYYYIVVTGIGNYTGSVKIPFYIAKDAMTDYKINLAETDIDFSSLEDDLKIEISSGSGATKKTVAKGEYDIEYYKVTDPTVLEAAGALYQKSDMDTLIGGMPGSALTTITEPGQYAIVAVPKDTGNYSGSIVFVTDDSTNVSLTADTITVKKALKDEDVTPYITSTLEGAVTKYNANCLVVSDGNKLTEDTHYTVAYKNAAGETVASNALQPDTTYTAEVTGKSAGFYKGTIKKSFSVSSSAKELKSGSTIVVAADAEYTGSPVTTTLGIFHGTESLTGGYTTVYVNNTEIFGSKNGTLDPASEAGVYIVGDGVQYYGMVSTDFNITQASADRLTVSPVADQTYNAVSVPSFTVTDNTGKELVRNNDYTVKYSTRLEDILGTVTYNGNGLTEEEKASCIASVRAAGVDSYLASIKNSTGKDREIYNALTDSANYNTAFTGTVKDAGTYIIQINATTANYTGTVHTVLTVNPVDLDSYTWTVGYDDDRTNGKIPYTGDDLSASIQNYLSISTGEGSSKKSVKAADAGIGVTPVDASVKEITEPGTYVVEIKAAGNYTGSRTVTVEVVKTLEESTTASVAVSATRNGSGNSATYTYEPKAIVNYRNKALEEGTDYTVEYYASTGEGSTTATGGAFTSVSSSDMTNSTQNYVAVITGTGAYEGTYEQAFTISKNQVNDLSEATAAFTGTSGYSTVYTGSPVTPAASLLTVTRPDGTAVTSASFDLYYSNNLDASSEATVTLVGKGTYYGQVSVKFTITPKSVAGLGAAIDTLPETVTAGSGGAPAYAVYNGKAADVDMMMNDAARLKKGKDYTLSFARAALDENGKAQQNADGSYATEDGVLEEIRDVGTYVVMATAQGNYTGSKYALFEVKQADRFAFTVVAKDQKYTGEAITDPEFLFYDENGLAIEVDAKDYTVEIYDADNQNRVEAVEEGTYTARLTGAGNYSDKATAAVAFTVTDNPQETQVEEIQKELDATKEELEAARKELEEAIANNEASQAQIADLTKEVEDQKAAVEELTKQIEELLAQAGSQQRVAQTITVTKKKKSFKAGSLKSKKGTFNIKAAAQTDLSYKTMKANNKVTVKANGKVVVKKGTKAGTYKVRVRAIAAKSDVFKKAIKNFTVTVVVK